MMPIPRSPLPPTRSRFAPTIPGAGCLLPALLIVAGLIAAALLFSQIRAAVDPDIRAAAAAERYRQQEIDSRLDWLDTLVAGAWRVLPVAVVGGAAFVALGTAWRRWARHEYIKAHHVTALTKASTQRFPAALHSLSFHDSSKMSPPAMLPALDTPQLAAPVMEVPTFRAALDAGAIGLSADGRRQPLILGYGSDGPLTGDWRSLYSSGIGGLQGSGKTWGAVFLLAQSAMNGARLVICDPHAHDSESLAHRTAPLAPAFLCDVADDDRSILASLKLADDVLKRRKAGDTDRTPCIVCVDEWASLRRGELATVLPKIIEDFSTEGRKLGCHILLLSQRWDKSAIGDFRNTLASSYVYRMRPDEARMMTGLRAGMMPQDTLSLQPGEAYLLNTFGAITRVHIPEMTPADLEIVGASLGRSAGSIDRPFGFRVTSKTGAPETKWKSSGNQVETKSNVVSSAPESGRVDSATARILALFASGVDIPTIVKEIYGAVSGREYQSRRAEIEAVIRAALATKGV